MRHSGANHLTGTLSFADLKVVSPISRISVRPKSVILTCSGDCTIFYDETYEQLAKTVNSLPNTFLMAKSRCIILILSKYCIP